MEDDHQRGKCASKNKGFQAGANNNSNMTTSSPELYLGFSCPKWWRLCNRCGGLSALTEEAPPANSPRALFALSDAADKQRRGVEIHTSAASAA
eukprot:3645030-Amphidinium_carterae.1